MYFGKIVVKYQRERKWETAVGMMIEN